MKRLVLDYLILYFYSIIISIIYAFIFEIKIFNPFHITSLIIVFTILAIFVYLSWSANKNHKSYAIDKYKNKLYLIFKFIFFLPLFVNIYLDMRLYHINSVEDFMKIEWNPNGKYVLDKNPDFKEFSTSNKYVIKQFNGTIIGQGKSINNLKYPLFSINDGTIENLYLQNINIDLPGIKLGSVASINNGEIINVHVCGTIKGSVTIGGIAGENRNLIEKSSYIGDIYGKSTIGGIAGINNDIIIYSNFKGKLNGQYTLGGLVGINRATVKRSYSEGNVNGLDSIGGIVGISFEKSAKVEDCYTLLEIIGEDSIGGIVGNKQGEIKSSFVLGSIKGENRVGVLSYGEEEVSSFIFGNIDADNYFAEPNIFYLKGDIYNGPDNITKDWFINVIELDEEIWDLSPVENNEFPILKCITDQPKIKFN